MTHVFVHVRRQHLREYSLKNLEISKFIFLFFLPFQNFYRLNLFLAKTKEIKTIFFVKLFLAKL